MLRLSAQPLERPLRSLQLPSQGGLRRIWGVALSSHLDDRRVSERMNQAAQQILQKNGCRAEIHTHKDKSALQPGAAFALFAEGSTGVRLGADRAGALGRSAESIGRHVAEQLLADWHTLATVDRFAADQIVPFAALAEGESRFRVPQVTDHLRSSAWLAKIFLGADVTIDGDMLTIAGVGHQARNVWQV